MQRALDYEYYPTTTDGALLPLHHSVVVNIETGLVTLVNWHTHTFVTETRFHRREIPVIALLLYVWPSSLPAVRLLATVTEQSTEKAARRLKEGDVDAVMAPVVRIIAACQGRLGRLGMTIVTGVDGYRVDPTPLERGARGC